MNKPITVAYEEFKLELASLINNSGMPMFLIESILQNYLGEVRAVAQKQYENDKKQYEASLQENTTQEETE